MSTTQSRNRSTKKSSAPKEVELIFDGLHVTGSWYDPKLQPIVCTLCGKGCPKDKPACYNANPYCG